MASNQPQTRSAKTNSASSREQLKLALAISLLRSKFQRKPSSSSDAPSESDALRWKRKAKERKQEIIRLREDLKEAEEASHTDLFPRSASCKCYFFDNLGELSVKRIGEASDQRFSDVLQRRFLRRVRFNERRAGVRGQKSRLSEFPLEDELEQLRASADFLVHLCEKDSHGNPSFSNWSHQAVDFILVSLKHLLPLGKNLESVDGIVSRLITQLVGQMLSASKRNASEQAPNDFQACLQHLIRQLGSESYIGQRAIFSASQRISVFAESLLPMDPFDQSYPEMHECMFILIQLIEFLIADNLLSWSDSATFDHALYEEWVACLLDAKKALEHSENRNGLYVLYIDRVIGELAKQVGQSSPLQKLKPDLLHGLFG